MKNIQLYVTSVLVLLILTACGSGGGGGDNGSTGQNQQPAPKTKATLKLNLTGTLPVGAAMSGVDYVITLPANVTPQLANNAVAEGVVTSSGVFASSSVNVLYTAASAGSPGTFRVTVTSNDVGGASQIGEVSTIVLQLANGATPTVGSFGVSDTSVVDTSLYNTISGMAVTVTGVTLQ